MIAKVNNDVINNKNSSGAMYLMIFEILIFNREKIFTSSP